ncbi:MAG: mRNA interferase MazF [Bacteroidia bacterium]|jgi:mRNA interferase MazF
MIQGEVWNANLNPTVGSEQGGFRPVVIVSGNAMNENLNVVLVCPITSKIKNYLGNVILQPDALNGLKKVSEILNIHVRYLPKDRLKKKVGSINEVQLSETKKGLNDLLTY